MVAGLLPSMDALPSIDSERDKVNIDSSVPVFVLSTKRPTANPVPAFGNSASASLLASLFIPFLNRAGKIRGHHEKHYRPQGAVVLNHEEGVNAPSGLSLGLSR